MKVYCSSRRTIIDGEVVTFSTKFAEGGGGHSAIGPFEISASRNAVMVHYANLASQEYLNAFEQAMKHASTAMFRIKDAGAGAASLYPNEPSEAQ